MEGKRLTTLEQALAELQAKDVNTQLKLDILISHIPQSENPIPSTQITPVTPKAHGVKLALLLGDAPHRPMSPPIFLRHLCIFLLIIASPRQSALAAPILESDDHVT